MAMTTRTVAASGADHTNVAGAVAWFVANWSYAGSDVARILLTDEQEYTQPGVYNLGGINGTESINSYLLLETDPSVKHDGTYNLNKARVKNTTSGHVYVFIDNYVHVKNMAIWQDNTEVSAEVFRVNANITNVLLEKCVLYLGNNIQNQDIIHAANYSAGPINLFDCVLRIYCPNSATDFNLDSLGADWDNGPGWYDPIVLSGGVARSTSAGSTYSAARYTGTTFNDDQYSEIIIDRIIDAGETNIGPCVRMNSTGQCYYMRINQNIGNSTLEVWRHDGGGTLVDLATNHQPGRELVPGDVCRLEVVGDRVAMDLNRAEVDFVVDTTYASGQPGITAIAATDVADAQMASWRGGDVPVTRSACIGQVYTDVGGAIQNWYVEHCTIDTGGSDGGTINGLAGGLAARANGATDEVYFHVYNTINVNNLGEDFSPYVTGTDAGTVAFDGKGNMSLDMSCRTHMGTIDNLNSQTLSDLDGASTDFLVKSITPYNENYQLLKGALSSNKAIGGAVDGATRDARIDTTVDIAGNPRPTYASGLRDIGAFQSKGLTAKQEGHKTSAGVGDPAVVDLPVNMANDNVIIMTVGVRAEKIDATPAGWTPINASAAVDTDLRSYWRKVDGSWSSDTSVSVSLSASAEWTAITYRFSNTADPSEYPPEGVSTFSDVNSTAPDSPNLVPNGGIKDYTWISTSFGRDDGLTTAWPYSTRQWTASGGLNSRLSSCDSRIIAASENPGAFTTDTGTKWSASTIAVYPAIAEVLVADSIYVPMVIRTPWTKQPPPGTQLDRNNPLTRNLFYAFGAGSSVDLVSNTVGQLRGGANLKGTEKGRVLNTDGVNDVYDSNVGELLLAANTDAWSAVWFGRTSAASGHYVGQREINNADCNFQFHLQATNILSARIGDLQIQLATDARINDGSWRMVGVTSAPGSNLVAGWVEGEAVGTPVAATLAPYTAANINMSVGARWATYPATGYPLAGDTIFALVWKDRELSAKEMFLLYADPFQIFKPRTLYVGKPPVGRKLVVF